MKRTVDLHIREVDWCAWNDDDMWEHNDFADRIDILLNITGELP